LNEDSPEVKAQKMITEYDSFDTHIEMILVDSPFHSLAERQPLASMY
jgi:hypothetical protein